MSFFWFGQLPLSNSGCTHEIPQYDEIFASIKLIFAWHVRHVWHVFCLTSPRASVSMVATLTTMTRIVVSQFTSSSLLLLLCYCSYNYFDSVFIIVVVFAIINVVTTIVSFMFVFLIFYWFVIVIIGHHYTSFWIAHFIRQFHSSTIH